MKWYERPWVAWDTETSGMNSEARVIELGIVTFERGVPVRRWSSLFNPPGLDWSHPDVVAATAVNKITREEVQGAPRFEDVLPQIMLEFTADVWVGHNQVFDARMLSYELQRAGTHLPEPEFRVCTLALARRQRRGAYGGNKLHEVAARFGVPLDGAHRAVADAEATGRILAKMVRDGHVPSEDDAMKRLCEPYAPGGNKKP